MAKMPSAFDGPGYIYAYEIPGIKTCTVDGTFSLKFYQEKAMLSTSRLASQETSRSEWPNGQINAGKNLYFEVYFLTAKLPK